MQCTTATIATPMGTMDALWGPHGLIALTWRDRLHPAGRHLTRHLRAYTVQPVNRLPDLNGPLLDYLSGDTDALKQVPTDPPGTPFQKTVWAALREIPPGETWSYGRLARHIGRPRATRAVAGANGANPIPLVIPCHRVIAADGSLGGFSAGLDRKRWLLAHENAWPPEAQRQTYLWKSKAESEKPRSTTSSPT